MNKRWMYLALLPLVLLVLSGCSVRELESRNFTLAVSLDYEDGRFAMIYTYPDLEALSEQANESDENVRNYLPKVTGDDMDEVQENYYYVNNKYLDYGHVKAIVLGKGLLSNQDKLAEALLYLEENELFARNVLLFLAEEDPDDIMVLNSMMHTDIGTYLSDLYKNNPYYTGDESVTLGDLLNHWHNQEEALLLPVLTRVDKRPVITAYGYMSRFMYKGNLR